MECEEFDCKVVLVGDSQCGKTSLVLRFTKDTFSETYTPTGFEKYGACYTMGECKIHFSIWDTSGAKAYDTLRPLAYQETKVFLLCFRLNDPMSLQNVWYPEIKQHSENVPVILCGCQSDLRKDEEKPKKSVITPEQAVLVSRQVEATTYVETSSRSSSMSVRDAFEVAALAALGKLNKQRLATIRQTNGYPNQQRSKTKVSLRTELKDRARSCTLM